MTRTVLVLDDEIWVATSVIDILAEFGLRVAGPFRSNATALSYLADHTPDVAILDFNVADGTSGRTAERLIELRTPFLAVFIKARPECVDQLGALASEPFSSAKQNRPVLMFSTFRLDKAHLRPLGCDNDGLRIRRVTLLPLNKWSHV